jgi:predicted Zn-dependent protease
MIRKYFYILFFLNLSFLGYTQDDTEEHAEASVTFLQDELEIEEKLLEFKSNFINALTQYNTENYAKATESLGKCEKIYPDNMAVWYQIAKNYFELKQYEDAHLYCDKILTQDSENFWALSLSRDIYERQYNFEQAIDIQKGLYRRKNIEADHLLRLYYRTKNMEEGKALIEEIDRNSIPVLSKDFYQRFFNKAQNIADETEESNNIDNASTGPKNSNNRTKEQKNNYQVLQKDLENEFKVGDFKKVVSAADDALALYPAQANLYLLKGKALNELTKYREAASNLETGLDFVFDNNTLLKEFYEALIKAYTGLKQTSKADYYKQLVQKL